MVLDCYGAGCSGYVGSLVLNFSTVTHVRAQYGWWLALLAVVVNLTGAIFLRQETAPSADALQESLPASS
jgi:hypothetical protein